MRHYLTAAVVLAIAAHRLGAQPEAKDDARWVSECRDQDRHDHARFCEVRVDHLATNVGPIDVDARENGAVEIIGGSTNDIVVHELVEAEASSEADAKDMASQIHVTTSGGRIHADGPPDRGHWKSWTVSYRVEVPRKMDVTAQSTNGPVEASDVVGRLDLRTENGPISLYAVGGAVHARTENGPLEVTLAGSRWDGGGLDAETENGPVELTLPSNYAAHLETGTVNGPMSIDFPITIQGRINPKQLSLDLGGGGPPVRVVTTNGPVTVGH
jgi:hypothetical protein